MQAGQHSRHGPWLRPRAARLIFFCFFSFSKAEDWLVRLNYRPSKAPFFPLSPLTSWDTCANNGEHAKEIIQQAVRDGLGRKRSGPRLKTASKVGCPMFASPTCASNSAMRCSVSFS